MDGRILRSSSEKIILEQSLHHPNLPNLLRLRTPSHPWTPPRPPPTRPHNFRQLRLCSSVLDSCGMCSEALRNLGCSSSSSDGPDRCGRNGCLKDIVEGRSAISLNLKDVRRGWISSWLGEQSREGQQGDFGTVSGKTFTEGLGSSVA